jgi:lipoate-protein ligase A
MRLFDLTLATPEENLALDEALLDEAEASAEPREALRLWESPEPLVVLGRSSLSALEVNLSGCQAQGIPVLRRTSGGAAIVAGRGCLMYAVVLSYELRPHLRALDAAHRFVLDTTLDALRPLIDGLRCQGTSDLTLGDAKVSGNSVRCKRRSFLYHGTLLYDFHLPLVDACLRMPPRQPAYRNDRAHQAFIANLPVSGPALRNALVAAWRADPTQLDWPRQRVDDLVATRYSQADWNFQR